ncbi:putative FAD-linked oxidoreductase [Nocardia cerradoensis]|uniref:Putative FAD-linked oxidoreductase n=1 Tax=Nocardia cerradoensis TaxID=85688 RepID=A0A231GUS9_9NOCA|nr:FAD-linked oxidase C-terminal domain-containing protein [Nocardia cerradoensis]OXR40389.1 putative FAD-linked oxidoreductase [Nocardia cerradoensis]
MTIPATGPKSITGTVLVGSAIPEQVKSDRSAHRAEGQPEVLVCAATVDDVRRAVEFAAEAGLTVVVRGAGSGLAGGASAGAGSLILDVSGLDRILRIAEADEYAVVEAGVSGAVLDAAAARAGLRYAPDPASVAISTIGGNIATNAGGLRCVKYGVTGDSVLGLSVVLADGRLLHTGRRTVKGVAGLDLTSLFTGSEGTLGVIVSATVRLQPIPVRTVTVAAYFDDVEQAAAATAAVLAARVRPAMLELLDGASLREAQEWSGVRGAAAGAFVVAQTDGFGADAEAAIVESTFARFASRVSVGTDSAAADELLTVRRAALPALERHGRVLIEDIAVPRSRIGEAVRRITEIAGRHDSRIYTFGHAGDGNLHPIIVVPEHDPAALGRAENAADEIFATALQLGGTITGEHGVGLLKRRWLERELGPDALRVQRAVRRALDPSGLFNPGKMF